MTAPTLGPDRECAVQSLRDAGCVVLRNVLSRGAVHAMRVAADAAMEELLTSIGGVDGLATEACGANRLGAFLSLVHPFGQTDVIANPAVMAVLRSMLGEDVELGFMALNCSFPGATYQEIHRDAEPTFGVERRHASPTDALIVNWPLCDFDDVSGATEVWPVTHHLVDTGAVLQTLQERARAMASVRLHARPGDAILRDPRLWHRGTPNRHTEARPMVAITYTTSWRMNFPLTVPDETWADLREGDRHLLAFSRQFACRVPVVPDHGQLLALEPK